MRTTPSCQGHTYPKERFERIWEELKREHSIPFLSEQIRPIVLAILHHQPPLANRPLARDEELGQMLGGMLLNIEWMRRTRRRGRESGASSRRMCGVCWRRIQICGACRLQYARGSRRCD